MDSSRVQNLGAGRGRNQGGLNINEIGQEKWSAAEAATWNDVLLKIHPTVEGEEQRADVTDFIENLITKSFNGVQVFPYGSVPLRTFLPSGDVDLTVICKPEMKNIVAQNLYALLKNEEFRTYGENRVKDTKLVDAEVKLVKCNVANIAVDISFNQLGGLSAVCFLEQVDRIINKNHLFKQSILLVKAWCHCESHILGAYQGLLSTYALESLILCIFQLFGSSLNGPLAVLYRFLDYYSKFDWTNCCISLDGPVRKWSLPELIVTDRRNGGAELLISGEALTSYMDLFAASSYSVEKDERRFPMKSFNIVDPLKGNNNLGRSVNKANCTRLIRAFKFGVRQLGRILEQPTEAIPGELQHFFQHTLKLYGSKGADLDRLSLSDLNALIESARTRDARNGPRKRLDVLVLDTSSLLDLTGDYSSQARGYAVGRCCLGYSSTIPALCRSPVSRADCQSMLGVRITPSSNTDHIPSPVAQEEESTPVQETPAQRESTDEVKDKDSDLSLVAQEGQNLEESTPVQETPAQRESTDEVKDKDSDPSLVAQEGLFLEESTPVQETPAQEESTDEDKGKDSEKQEAPTEEAKDTEKKINLDSKEEFPPLSSKR